MELLPLWQQFSSETSIALQELSVALESNSQMRAVLSATNVSILQTAHWAQLDVVQMVSLVQELYPVVQQVIHHALQEMRIIPMEAVVSRTMSVQVWDVSVSQFSTH